MRPDAPCPSTQTSAREGWDAMDAVIYAEIKKNMICPQHWYRL